MHHTEGIKAARDRGGFSVQGWLNALQNKADLGVSLIKICQDNNTDVRRVTRDYIGSYVAIAYRALCSYTVILILII